MRSLLIVALVSVALPAWSAPSKRLGEDADDAFAELDKKFVLRFFDAVSGKPVAGARVEFEEASGATNDEGAVSLPMPKGLGAAEKTIDATFSRKGYVTTKIPVRFMVGTLFFNRFSVTPSLPPGLVRIVLDWDRAPADLDSHLVKDGAWHISFRDTRKYEDLAWLDRDCMTGYGAETITVARFDSTANYRYFVHDFTNQRKASSEALGVSKATVRVYTERGLWRTFYVSPSLVGDRWEVFRFVNGEIVAP